MEQNPAKRASTRMEIEIPARIGNGGREMCRSTVVRNTGPITAELISGPLHSRVLSKCSKTLGDLEEVFKEHQSDGVSRERFRVCRASKRIAVYVCPWLIINGSLDTLGTIREPFVNSWGRLDEDFAGTSTTMLTNEGGRPYGSRLASRSF